MNVLVVEDESRIAFFLEKGLRAHGYAVQRAASGREALERLEVSDVDLVILDIGLPDIDGYEILCRARSRRSHVPIIILTARKEVGDLVRGLDLGADDYLTKPFSFDELLARVRARLRGGPARDRATLRAGGLTLDLRTRRATVGERSFDLGAREFGLLETLVRHRGHVLSREELLSGIWGSDLAPESNVVAMYVSYLRKKLGATTIETVRGMGYRMPG